VNGQSAAAIAHESALLALLAGRQLATLEICAALSPATHSAVRSRLNRMHDRHALVKVGRNMWAVAGNAGDEPVSEPETIENTPRPAFDPTRWVQHVDFYVRTETNMFACRRFG
jgi:hypothetical protein